MDSADNTFTKIVCENGNITMYLIRQLPSINLANKSSPPQRIPIRKITLHTSSTDLDR
jgi:hypothetical protein